MLLYSLLVFVSYLLSRVQLLVTPWTVALQAPQSMEYSKQEYWNGLPRPSPGYLRPRDWTEVFCIASTLFYCLSHQGSKKPYAIFYILLNHSIYFLSEIYSECLFKHWNLRSRKKRMQVGMRVVQRKVFQEGRNSENHEQEPIVTNYKMADNYWTLAFW